MSKVSAFIKANAGHGLGVILAIAALYGGHVLLEEHDARVVADATVKQAKTEIASLQAQQATALQAAKVQVVQLRAQAVAVKTVPEAIKEIPTVESTSTETLAPEPIPDDPSEVAVQALPLYQQLNECKQASVNLNACTVDLSLQQSIDAQKDKEITALKNKPSFFKRIGDAALTVGIGVAIGLLTRH